MVRIPRLSLVCGLLALCSAFTLRANADVFTQSGTFTSDGEVAGFSFSTTQTQVYNFYTTSYSGGTNADGSMTAAGGFDPVLSLFNSDGSLFTGEGTAVSNGGSDAYITDILTPGSYILALSEFPNFSNDGTLTGYGAFTTSNFVDLVTGNQLNGNYTVNYTSSVTPEPSSALLVLLPLAGAVVLSRRKFAPNASV